MDNTVCNICTYINNHILSNCEICGSKLTSSSSSLASKRDNVIPETISLIDDDDDTKSCPQCTIILSVNCIQCSICDYLFIDNIIASDQKVFCSISSVPCLNPSLATRKRWLEGSESTLKSSPKLSTRETKGLIPLIEKCLYTQNNCQFILCSEIPFISQRQSEFGNCERWSCGYRNIQMMVAAVKLSRVYNEKDHPELFNMSVSSVMSVQESIEMAWQRGYDIAGAEHLGHLKGTSKLIGATECVSLLRCMGVSATAVDFNSADQPVHTLLCEWVKSYFDKLRAQNSFILPLYLQNQGHSITVIGYEMINTNMSLLVFDPSNEANTFESALVNKTQWQKFVKRGVGFLSNRSQYQIVYASAPWSSATSKEFIIRGEKPTATDFQSLSLNNFKSVYHTSI